LGSFFHGLLVFFSDRPDPDRSLRVLSRPVGGQDTPPGDD